MRAPIIAVEAIDSAVWPGMIMTTFTLVRASKSQLPHRQWQVWRAMMLLLATCALPGCSSLGLSLWPANLPLLSKARQFSNESPIRNQLHNELAKTVLPDYYLEPGDRILIEPTQLDSEFQSFGDQEIKVDGSVDLGRFGRIRIAGMTVEQVEVAIANQVSSYLDEPETVNVQLVDTRAAKIYVLGAVGSPGVYEIDGNETVLDAILLAGGLTSRASPCDILMVRPTRDCECRVVQRICYRQITQLGDVSTNYQLQPGDRVVVGERTLCEELAVWRQSTACPCCDRSRCVERRPESQQYSNRITSWLAPFALPKLFEDENDAIENDLETGSYFDEGQTTSGNDEPLIRPAQEMRGEEVGGERGPRAPTETESQQSNSNEAVDLAPGEGQSSSSEKEFFLPPIDSPVENKGPK